MCNLSNSKRKKRIEEIIKNFRPIDDTFLSFLIQSDNSIVEYILRVIMNMSSLKVIEVHSQDYVKNIFGRSACFDILAKDENDKIYNIEIQRSNAGAIYKRARFNSSMLDIKSIEAGENLDSLKETKEGNKQMCEIAEELIAEGRAEANAENKEQFTNILKDKFGLSHEEAVKLIEDSFKASNMSV